MWHDRTLLHVKICSLISDSESDQPENPLQEIKYPFSIISDLAKQILDLWNSPSCNFSFAFCFFIFERDIADRGSRARAPFCCFSFVSFPSAPPAPTINYWHVMRTVTQGRGERGGTWLNFIGLRSGHICVMRGVIGVNRWANIGICSARLCSWALFTWLSSAALDLILIDFTTNLDDFCSVCLHELLIFSQ